MKFGQLAEFRNGIRRSRSVDEITRSELPGRGELKIMEGSIAMRKLIAGMVLLSLFDVSAASIGRHQSQPSSKVTVYVEGSTVSSFSGSGNIRGGSGCGAPRAAARTCRAGVLRNRALLRRPDFGDHGAAGRRLCGGRRDGLEVRPQKRPLPPALGFRVADRDVLRNSPGWVAVPDHLVRTGRKCGRPAADSDPIAHRSEPQRNHGEAQQLAAR